MSLAMAQVKLALQQLTVPQKVQFLRWSRRCGRSRAVEQPGLANRSIVSAMVRSASPAQESRSVPQPPPFPTRPQSSDPRPEQSHPPLAPTKQGIGLLIPAHADFCRARHT